MNQPLQLIFVDSSPNDVEEMVSSIKTSGTAVRSRIAQDADDLTTLLSESQPHIILHSLEDNEVSLEQTISTINGRAPEIPVIALTKSAEKNPVTYMQRGATTLVSKNNTEHLQLVVNSTAKTQFHIQQLKEVAASCGELENRCQILMESSRDAICYLHEGMHTYANKKYLEKFGYSSCEELYGLSIMDLVAPDDQEKMKDLLKKFSKTKDVAETALNFKKESSDIFSAKFSFNSVSISGEDCIQIVIQGSQNGGDTKELEEQLSYLSEHDVHTGFYHRRSIMDQLDGAANAAKQGEVSQTFIQIDISNFSDIKDKFGIAAIDKVSSNIAKTLRDCCTENETLSKLTEESFGVLTSKIDSEYLHTFGQNVIRELGELITTSGSDYISIEPVVGAVKIDHFTTDVRDILNKAKNCCDQAWENNTNEIVIYVPNEDQIGEKEKDDRWTLTLREAVKENRLELLYQPIISLHGEPGERYQIYTALHGKDNELVPASEFVTRIERTGFAKMLDRWIILNALKKLSELREKGADIRLFIKLSSNSVLDKDLPSWLGDQFNANNISPSHVCFEIKEQVLISNLEESKILVSALQETKSEIAIDSFGTANNPTKILKAIPANYVKICHSLMSDITDNKENQNLIRDIAEILKPMKTKVIAQFVEDADTLSILWSLGINYTQGNFLQPPNKQPNYDFSL